MSGGEQPASRSELLAALTQNKRLLVEFRKTDGSPPSEQMRGADEQHVRFTKEQLVRQPARTRTEIAYHRHALSAGASAEYDSPQDFEATRN